MNKDSPNQHEQKSGKFKYADGRVESFTYRGKYNFSFVHSPYQSRVVAPPNLGVALPIVPCFAIVPCRFAHVSINFLPYRPQRVPKDQGEALKIGQERAAGSSRKCYATKPD